jgi:hypothetical protein
MSASPDDAGRAGDPVRHRRTFVLIPLSQPARLAGFLLGLDA